jgi:tetratricopeptide (TPR) repeat protein
MTRFLTACALSCTMLLPATALAQHEDHGAMSPDQIGSASVKFDTSCAPAVREDFNKAIALLHSFWFGEATTLFEAIVEKDPACAMAYWGLAMTQWGNPFGGLRTAASIERGKATVARAQSTGTPTPRERALIDAVAILYSSADPATQYQRITRYEAAMEAVAAAYPSDVETRIFYALAVSQSALPTDKTYAKQLKAGSILEPLFRDMPTHPGLAHYIIHAYDAPPLADKALEAARRYASLAPAIPHALHMPSHTFTRVGSWKESIETNRRSAEAARKSGGVGEELHALDYQTYAYLQLAQDKAAKAVLDHAMTLAGASPAGAGAQPTPGAPSGGTNSFAIAAIPARYALERGDWSAAAQLTVRPASTPYTEAITHFARAIGAARSGHAAEATADIARLSELVEKLKSMQDAYWAEQVDLQRRVATAWQTFAQGRQDEAIRQLASAADAEDLTDKAAVTPGPLAPARELLGFMLLEANQPQEALAAFERTMKKEPNRFRATYGAARAADAIGDRTKARAYYAQLIDLAGEADTERPELAQARKSVTR